jgi:hypothetical protein
MASGGGSQPSSQTVSTSQQIPLYEQQFSQQNQALAQSLGSQPYPQYQGALEAGFTPAQQQGQAQAIDAAGSYQPLLNAGVASTANAMASSPSNPGVISSLMSPYVQSALQPQVTALQTQLGQQQNQLGAQATQANAFGDARQGAQQSLNNFYGNQALNGLEAQGYNTAYNNALQTAVQEQGVGLQGGQQLANLGGLNQQLGLTGAGAIYNVGQQQQTLQQQELNTAYQQYMNQVQWPYQQLNVQESALSNSPYNMSNQVTLPNANQSAQNLGLFSSLAGLLGGSTSSGGVFGGQAYNSSTAHS